MKEKMHAIILVIALLMFTEHAWAQDIEPKQIESTRLKQTIITPHMEEQITVGKNLIYCSTFQIAWNMLQDEFIKDDILLEEDPLLVRFLNKQLSTKNDISEECYVAVADTLTSEFVQRINSTLREKFGEHAPPEVKCEYIPGPLCILSYAFLYKNLEFEKEFESLAEPIRFQSNIGTAQVSAFGIKQHVFGKEHVALAKQVSIIDFTDDDNFIISLKSKSVNDEIILAKIQPKKTLLRTIEAVQDKISQSRPSGLREEETLQIPKLDFNVRHTFSELLGKKIENKDWEGWFIHDAMQWVRFRLNEKGAMLKSEARIYAVVGISPEPRKFVFDKPFLICLKQNDSQYPYFAMWVDNPELLLKEL